MWAYGWRGCWGEFWCWISICLVFFSDEKPCGYKLGKVMCKRLQGGQYGQILPPPLPLNDKVVGETQVDQMALIRYWQDWGLDPIGSDPCLTILTHEIEYKLVPTEYKLSHLMPQTTFWSKQCFSLLHYKAEAERFEMPCYGLPCW